MMRKYELDHYLFGRSTESKKEQPLFRAGGPGYLNYQKGSLALYHLRCRWSNGCGCPRQADVILTSTAYFDFAPDPLTETACWCPLSSNSLYWRKRVARRYPAIAIVRERPLSGARPPTAPRDFRA
jgi:hypothetical protein